MAKIKKCRKCGVPVGIGKNLFWQGSGVITQAKDPGHRVVFCECDHIDEILHSVEDLIGLPIEQMVIESKRRYTRAYVEKQVSPLVRRVLHRYRPKVLTDHIRRMAIEYGYGGIELDEIRNKGDDGDFQAVTITHPYSLAFFCGDSLGTKEAMDGRDFEVAWEKIGDHMYRITSRVGEHPVELRERLERKGYQVKPGDLQYERCPSCGVPLGVARCHWDVEEGTIIDPGTGRRMAVYSPESIEVVLEDLASELGEGLPEAVIEVHRRFFRNVLGRDEALANQAGYREMVGLRGLGYLRSAEFGARRCAVVIENACLPLLMVGVFKGLFEMVSENENSVHRWELRPDGDLAIEITAGEAGEAVRNSGAQAS